jgi:hypothetical protein
MKKTILLIFSLCLMAITTAQALTVASTAGGLSTAITTVGGNLSTITNLTITGTIDARDFKIMRDSMPKLAAINLSAVTIAAYTGTQGTQGSDNNYVYAANDLPSAAFDGRTNLTSVTLPSSLTSIGDGAFGLCSGLTSITIPSSVTSIGEGAFIECGLTSITIPSSVTSIGQNAFENCTGLTSITIPSSVTSIGTYAFEWCTALTSINIPSSVTSIGDAAFQGCTGLSSITLSSSLTSIGAIAFTYCTHLTSITIPSSVTSIGGDAFDGCTSLSSIYSYATTPVDLTSSAQVFYAVNTTTCTLYVPLNSANLYKAANQWQDFTHIVGIIGTAVQQIQDNVSIFPNPIVDNFNISGLTTPQTLQLFDLNGKLIFSQQVDNGTLPASFLQTGIYILKIGSFETKLIKQ